MSPFCLTLVCLSNIISSFATDPPSGELYATLQPDIIDLLMGYLPSDYDLPENIYEWNVTEIVGYINAEDPELLYTIDTSLLFTLFPEYFIQQMPRDILIAHKLYAYLSIDDPLYCFNMTNCTTNLIIPPIDACYGPFVHTKYKGVFVFPNGSDTYQCALRCEHVQVLYGIDDQEMSIVDNFNVIFCSLFLTLCIVIWLNICMDIKFSKQQCLLRPFLFHAPICLVLMYTILAVCFLLPLIIGKENIACADDINDVKTFGSFNPGSSTMCTVMGITFYFAELAVGCYTLFFSVSLWSQFSGAISSVLTNQYCDINKCLCTVEKVRRIKKSSNNKDSQCIQILVSRTMLAHFAIYLFVITYIIIGYFDDAIGAIPPLGICALGTLGNDNSQYISYQIVPLSIISILSTLFLPAAIVLLIHIAKQTKSTSIKTQFSKLKWRLLVYFIFVEIAWFGVVSLILIFHVQRDQFEVGAEERTKCMLLNSGRENECLHGYGYWIGYYMLIGLTLPIAALGSLVLSCGGSNRSRWRILLGFCCFRRQATADENMLKQLGEIVGSHTRDVTRTDITEQTASPEINTGAVITEAPNLKTLTSTSIESNQAKGSDSEETIDNHNGKAIDFAQ